MEPTIIYEDAHVLVLNKPAGLAVHGDGKSSHGTVTDWLIARNPKLRDVGEPFALSHGAVPRAGLAHRLDRETSGVLVAAKDGETLSFIQKQFEEGTAQKEYLAFVAGNIREDKGSVDRPIGRSRRTGLFSASKKVRGKVRNAETSFCVLARTPRYSFLLLTPKTGRTHQLRVHLASIHHPVVGDSLHGPGKENDLGITRLALHAVAVTVRLPDAVERRFEAPLHGDFAEALRRLGLTEHEAARLIAKNSSSC